MNAKFKEFNILVAVNVVISALSFFGNNGLAVHLGAEKFGQYSYVLILGTLLGQFVIFGTEQTAPGQFVRHGKAIVSEVLFARIINLIIVFNVALVWYFLTNDILILFSIIIAAQGLNLSYIYELDRGSIKHSLIILTERVLFYGCLWLSLLYVNDLTLIHIFLCLFVWTVVSIGFQFKDKITGYGWLKKLPRSSIWSVGFVVLFFSITKYMYGGGTRFFIKSNLTYTDLGLFSLVWQVVPMVTIFLGQAVKTWRLKITDALFHSDLTGLCSSISQMSLLTLGPISIGALVLLSEGARVINWIFPREYSEVVNLLPWLAIYMIVIAFDMIVAVIWIALEKYKLLGALYAVFSLICLGVMWVWGNIFALEDYLATVVICHGASVVVALIICGWILRNKFQGAL